MSKSPTFKSLRAQVLVFFSFAFVMLGLGVVPLATAPQGAIARAIAPLATAAEPAAATPTQQFTLEQLAQFDGKDGRPAYVAFEGKVYDVTTSKTWQNGEHFGVLAGRDGTAAMVGAPHGAEVFAKVPQIGVIAVTSAISAPREGQESVQSEKNQPQPWYAGRLRLLNISILGWTGILLGVFFVLTFGTCFALPWGQEWKLPWVGSKPGPDPLDASGRHLPWTAMHKYFVWVTVILGLVHGILGFLQLIGVYL